MATKVKAGRIAVYPGTFDPVTNGHMSLIERAARLFDKLIVAVADNAEKSPLFSTEHRQTMIQESIAARTLAAPVSVITFDGLLAELAVSVGAAAIVRGLRAVSDFEYEFQMALMNRRLARDVEAVFLMPSLAWVYLSSTIVKDVALNGGDITALVPEPVEKAFQSLSGSAADS
ncbi:MAG: pantetheine-phosphate adenylyltransferase, partial [Candidatus Zixiibacteriota bacterium]